ncbi:ATP-dependent helicase [Actinoalloteichus caeruleus]|uniref:ATP-dependent helicase n=1 Tax=Actinoalloteichus cyanogriseus TaxID=2893586 RepID=UPI003BB85ACD
MSAPAASLVRARRHDGTPHRWDQAALRVLHHGSGLLRVLGGPGTGKTTLLAEAAAHRILSGSDPESVLVLTSGRRAASELRTRITGLVASRSGQAGSPVTVREPMVRTVHSYAFGILRREALLVGAPPPRLLSGPDQDAVIRDLLAGDVGAGATNWPAHLRPALLLPGFAAELRDLLLRAAERGLGPEDLAELGERHGVREWVAAGRFGEQYEQVNLLRAASGSASPQAAPAMDAAELVSSALGALGADEELLATERARVHHLFVDDAQHLDPLQYRLVREVGDGARELVLAGDPDQTVFSFRGADPRGLLDADPDGRRTTVLTTDHRMAPAVREAVRRLAARLPGTGPQRDLRGPAEADTDGGGDQEVPAREATDGAPRASRTSPAPSRAPSGTDTDTDTGSVRVRVLGTAAQEATWIADEFRRAHLLDGVPWSSMAVVVRSATRALPVLRRSLAAAGVPLAMSASEVPLAQQHAVRPLVEVLRCAGDPDALTEDTATYLLGSQLGGADPLTMKRVRRELRRLATAAGVERPSGELLVEALLDRDSLVGLDERTSAPVHAVAEVLGAARTAVADGANVEEALWRAWEASGLQERWLAWSRRSGPVGAQADRDLDAVLALFDAAARFTHRSVGKGPAAFAEELIDQQIVGDSLAPTAPTGEAVSVLTAHAAAGREWTVVAVPGVQEGTWPDLRQRGSLLRVERLVDLLAGLPLDVPVSPTAPLLAEERRLLLLAASRATRTLLVSAVRGEDQQPSRFLDEVDGTDTDADQEGKRQLFRPPRGLGLAELVAELRSVVCAPVAEDEDPDRRDRAAAALAELAVAGVPGADPASWYGLGAPSTDDPLWPDGEALRVSPSTVDVLTRCPLRWVVERHGGQDEAQLASVTGTLVHALVERAATGATPDELRAELDRAWESVDAGAPWFSRRERRRVEAMLDSFLAWFTSSRAELTQVAVEHPMDLKIPPERPGGAWLLVRGRVDRLDVDADGRPVVVDIKTARAAVTAKVAEGHPQLAVYQLAAALGAFSEFGAADDDETGGRVVPPGGARLLYVAKPDARSGSATERTQRPLDDEGVRQWLGTVRAAGEASRGPRYDVNESEDCDRCPARFSCPLHPSGRQVGE